jgi:hypothetical protein
MCRMATELLNGVPYECRINAVDLASGKPLSNIIYLRYYNAGLLYADPVNLTDLDTANGNLQLAWTASIRPNLSANYKNTGLVCRAIVGRRWPTPFVGIAGANFVAGTAEIITTTPSGFEDDDYISITETLPGTSLLGLHGPIVALNSTTIQFPFAGIADVVTSGRVQLVRGAMEFIYGDSSSATYAGVGGIAGDACPLFTSVSMRRFNSGSGRNWRSRLSLSPIAEGSQINGRLTGPYYTNLIADATTFFTTTIGAGAQVMNQVAVSKELSFMTPTPFGESASWTRPVTGGAPQPNCGSVVRRKPKLTSAIA